MEVKDLCLLTLKQAETVRLLALGHTSKEMAQKLGVSASAIDQRIECILRRNGLYDRRTLARIYLEASHQTITEAPQVVTTASNSPISKPDRRRSDVEVPAQETIELHGISHAGTLPIPETVGRRVSLVGAELRSILEAVFFATMTILGVCSMLKQTLG